MRFLANLKSWYHLGRWGKGLVLFYGFWAWEISANRKSLCIIQVLKKLFYKNLEKYLAFPLFVPPQIFLYFKFLIKFNTDHKIQEEQQTGLGTVFVSHLYFIGVKKIGTQTRSFSLLLNICSNLSKSQNMHVYCLVIFYPF